METKTHWKKLVNPDYLGAYSFQPNEEKTLTIKTIVRDKVKGTGGKTQECTICHFIEKEKPMILNRLNSKTISKIYGTPYIEDWVNKKIVLFVDKVDAFGETVDAIRIRMIKPSKPVLTADSKSYTLAVDFLKNQNGTIEGIQVNFDLSDEIIIKLKQDAGIK